eukprot:CAMPEP_0118949580 /NCGR_PEP_ID=MMETSP1169-20130426/49906_1 /TAXON_ID=36882 /ORGANISM="Pyramimonas obovata, Strain CCMP722" /LENGTH=162 /DNA_ID=CAMNT_0006896255 /DNA_START=115 /DNA_END=604 /DNA_ORIENTATION=+
MARSSARNVMAGKTSTALLRFSWKTPLLSCFATFSAEALDEDAVATQALDPAAALRHQGGADHPGSQRSAHQPTKMPPVVHCLGHQQPEQQVQHQHLLDLLGHDVPSAAQEVLMAGVVHKKPAHQPYDCSRRANCWAWAHVKAGHVTYKATCDIACQHPWLA